MTTLSPVHKEKQLLADTECLLNENPLMTVCLLTVDVVQCALAK